MMKVYHEHKNNHLNGNTQNLEIRRMGKGCFRKWGAHNVMVWMGDAVN